MSFRVAVAKIVVGDHVKAALQEGGEVGVKHDGIHRIE